MKLLISKAVKFVGFIFYVGKKKQLFLDIQKFLVVPVQNQQIKKE